MYIYRKECLKEKNIKYKKEIYKINISLSLSLSNVNRANIFDLYVLLIFFALKHLSLLPISCVRPSPSKCKQ